jgi:hypothetical protein
MKIQAIIIIKKQRHLIATEVSKGRSYTKNVKNLESLRQCGWISSTRCITQYCPC